MPERTIGVAAMGGDANEVLSTIQDFEQRGIAAAWLTGGGGAGDSLTLLAAAAAATERILLGTCIVTTLPRHPVTAAQQVQVISSLSGGRFRYGVGTGNVRSIGALGIEFNKPLTNLREYITIVKSLLDTGAVEFNGTQYETTARLAEPVPGVPVMAAALRPRAYEVCGEVADGAISWASPGPYLRDFALPAMRKGAAKAGRPVPPLIAHAPICVHENKEEVIAAAREQMPIYPRSPFYQQMFAMAGHPEAAEIETWSEAMVDSVVLWGNEERVAQRVEELFACGVSELIITILTAGPDPEASRARALDLVAGL